LGHDAFIAYQKSRTVVRAANPKRDGDLKREGLIAVYTVFTQITYPVDSFDTVGGWASPQAALGNDEGCCKHSRLASRAKTASLLG